MEPLELIPPDPLTTRLVWEVDMHPDFVEKAKSLQLTAAQNRSLAVLVWRARYVAGKIPLLPGNELVRMIDIPATILLPGSDDPGLASLKCDLAPLAIYLTVDGPKAHIVDVKPLLDATEVSVSGFSWLEELQNASAILPEF